MDWYKRRVTQAMFKFVAEEPSAYKFKKGDMIGELFNLGAAF